MAQKTIKVKALENGVGGEEVRKGDTIEIPETSLEGLKEIGSVEEIKEEAPKKKK